mmetsp:Transcript_8755/g.28706  ORF Transcript_8755/g.28706 Transcript_8755/m.28706 type:complete len:238 (-) Transcript_8755:925-1638(-)
MYSFGVKCRLDSKWCMLCCETYAILKLWCFQIVPDCGSISPTIFFINVVLPAPFAPTIATREPKYARTHTCSKMFFSPPSYLKVTSSSLITTWPRFLIPSKTPGSGKTSKGFSLEPRMPPFISFLPTPLLPPIVIAPLFIAETSPAVFSNPKASRRASSFDLSSDDASPLIPSFDPSSTSNPFSSACFEIASKVSLFILGKTKFGFLARKPGNPPSNTVSFWFSKCTMSVHTLVKKS